MHSLILIVNLGSPSNPSVGAVRRYLREFLTDPRMVELPSLFWRPLLETLILPFRPQKSAKLYQKIWLDEGAPLIVYSQRLTNAINTLVNHQAGDQIKVAFATRYGSPSIKDVLLPFENKLENLVVLPLFPQYSAATSGSVFDRVTEVISAWRAVPSLKFIRDYYSNAEYLDACASQIRAHWEKNPAHQLLLLSFHGIPQFCVNKGDPYYDQCQSTAQAIAQRLNLAPDAWRIVFQSRFGRLPWLEPYCDQTLMNLPKESIQSVDIFCPGFAVDCLETIEEINDTNRALFLNAGGKNYHFIPCLNDSPEHAQLLFNALKPHILF